MGAPKRMSDILASSSTDTRPASPHPPTTPYSSSDPTLPLVSATNEHSTRIPDNGRKRKRAPPSSEAAVPAAHPQADSRTTNHPSLYTPWTLLGGAPRKALASRTVVPIVYTKNQNVRSGIRKLTHCLGARGADGGEGAVALDGLDGEGVLAVSAQGEGTVKMVGIVDLVRRIVGKRQEKGKGEGVKWYAYTVLSSVVVLRKMDARAGAGGAERARAETQRVESEPEADDGDAMHIDSTADGAVNSPQPQPAQVERSGSRSDTRGEKEKAVPVLTVWMTRKRMPSFREAFGELEFVVYKSAD